MLLPIRRSTFSFSPPRISFHLSLPPIPYPGPGGEGKFASPIRYFLRQVRFSWRNKNANLEDLILLKSIWRIPFSSQTCMHISRSHRLCPVPTSFLPFRLLFLWVQEGRRRDLAGLGAKRRRRMAFRGLPAPKAQPASPRTGRRKKEPMIAGFWMCPPPLEKEGGGTKPQCASCALGSAVGRSHARVSNVPKRE